MNLAEAIERAEREDQEWREALLHIEEHGTWRPRWDCPQCTGEPLLPKDDCE